MSKQYACSVYPGPTTGAFVFLTAGAQGLTVVECEIGSAGSGGGGLMIARAGSLVGGSALPDIHPLQESDPAALSTVMVGVTSFTNLGQLGNWYGVSSTAPPFSVSRRHPIAVAPGSSLVFQGNGTVSVNIYFEE